MKALKILFAAAVLFYVSNFTLEAKKAEPQQLVIEQMVNEVQKDIRKSFYYKDISPYVAEDQKLTVVLTVRVCRDCCIKVLSVEGGNEDLTQFIEDTINNNDIKTDEICKYRLFRFPLSFVYRK